jgi:UDP-N-acetylglucosamine 2-epimerase (non-hydrolysing)
MPEEINRLVTDAISDQLLVSEPAGVENLRNEGHAADRVHLVGNLMIDTLTRLLPSARETTALSDAGVIAKQYGVVTLHRPSNVDQYETLSAILDVLVDVSQRLPLVFPMHPRTSAQIARFGLETVLDAADGIIQMPPLGYLQFLALTSCAKVIVTDSGGLQEESTALGVPCLTMRANTERPCTVSEGSSVLVGNDADELERQLESVLAGEFDVGRCPPLWDGQAAQRVVAALIGDTSVTATNLE